MMLALLEKSNPTDRMWAKCYILLTFEFNTGITKIPVFLQSINISFKGRDEIAVSLYVPDTS